MATKRSDKLARLAVPELDTIIEARRGDKPAIRGEEHVVDLLLVTRQAREGLFGCSCRGERRRSLFGPEEERVVVGASDQRLGVMGHALPVSSEREGFRLGVVGRRLARVVEWPGAEDKVRTQRHRVDPVRVLVERADQLALRESATSNRKLGFAFFYSHQHRSTP
jgi:hypothetical protein